MVHETDLDILWLSFEPQHRKIDEHGVRWVCIEIDPYMPVVWITLEKYAWLLKLKHGHRG